MDRMTETEARELLEYIYNKPSYLFLGQAYQRESLNKNSYLDKLYAEAGCSDSIHSWRNLLEDHSDSIDQIYDTAADLSVSVSVPFLSELVNLPWNLFITSSPEKMINCQGVELIPAKIDHLSQDIFTKAPKHLLFCQGRGLCTRRAVGSCLAGQLSVGVPHRHHNAGAECAPGSAWFPLCGTRLSGENRHQYAVVYLFSGCCLCRPARLRRRSVAGGPVCGYHMGRRIGAFVYAGIVQRRHRFLDDVDQSAAPASVGRCCDRCDRPCGHPVRLACIWLCRCRFVRSCHNGGYLAGYRQNYVRQQCRQNADDHHYQGAGNCGRNFPPMRARLNDGQSGGHIHRYGTADAALRLCQTAGVPHPNGCLPHRPRLHGHGDGNRRGLRRGLR